MAGKTRVGDLQEEEKGATAVGGNCRKDKKTKIGSSNLYPRELETLSLAVVRTRSRGQNK